MKLQIGNKAPSFMAETVTGQTIYLKDFINKPVLIKFYRFASCPVCNLHLREFIRKYEQLSDAGLSVVIVYHSPRRRMEETEKEYLPFPVIADPQKVLFRKYAVKNSIAGMFSFAVWRDYMLALFAGYPAGMLSHDGGITGHPADFLVDKNGVLRYTHYGIDYSDSMSVAQVLETAKKLDLIEAEEPVHTGFAQGISYSNM